MVDVGNADLRAFSHSERPGCGTVVKLTVSCDLSCVRSITKGFGGSYWRPLGSVDMAHPQRDQKSSALLLWLREKASYSYISLSTLSCPEHFDVHCLLFCKEHRMWFHCLSSLPQCPQRSPGSLSCPPHSLALSRRRDYIALAVDSEGPGSQPCSATRQAWTSPSLHFLLWETGVMPALWGCLED